MTEHSNSEDTLSPLKNRLEWVDYAKGIAIILVVYRHILIGIRRSGMEVALWLINANEIVYSFRMPLFFVLSGIFVAKSIAKRSKLQFIKLKLHTILYPYFVWGMIQLIIQVVLSDYTNASRDMHDFLYLFIHPRAIDQLWYLYALFNVSVLFHFLYSYLKLNNIYLVVIALMFYGISIYVKPYSLIHDTLYYLIFFVIGHIISSFVLNNKHQKTLHSFIPFIILFPIFWLTQWFWLYNQDMNIFLFCAISLIGTFFIFSLSMILDRYGILKFIKIAGKHSLYIYLMHLLIVSAIRIVFINFLNIDEPIVILISGWIAGTILPIWIYTLLKPTVFSYLFRFPAKSP